jgi:hypothetical protein
MGENRRLGPPANQPRAFSNTHPARVGAKSRRIDKTSRSVRCGVFPQLKGTCLLAELISLGITYDSDTTGTRRSI